MYFVEVMSSECVLRVPCPRVWGGRALVCPMPKGLRRHYGQRHLRFVTCNCYRRLPLLRSAQAKNERERSKTAKPCPRRKPGTGARSRLRKFSHVRVECPMVKTSCAMTLRSPSTTELGIKSDAAIFSSDVPFSGTVIQVPLFATTIRINDSQHGCGLYLEPAQYGVRALLGARSIRRTGLCLESAQKNLS